MRTLWRVAFTEVGETLRSNVVSHVRSSPHCGCAFVCRFFNVVHVTRDVMGISMEKDFGKERAGSLPIGIGVNIHESRQPSVSPTDLQIAKGSGFHFVIEPECGLRFVIPNVLAAKSTRRIGDCLEAVIARRIRRLSTAELMSKDIADPESWLECCDCNTDWLNRLRAAEPKEFAEGDPLLLVAAGMIVNGMCLYEIGRRRSSTRRPHPFFPPPIRGIELLRGEQVDEIVSAGKALLPPERPSSLRLNMEWSGN